MDRLNEVKVPKRILNTLVNSLTAGVVPRAGAPYIAIGRRLEVEALLNSLSAVEEGGSAIRFIIGRYGSGKSFLLQLVRGFALDRDFLTADADLSPERRLCGGNGCGLATYRELIRNLASKASPDGGALPVVLSRHYARLCSELASDGVFPEHPQFEAELKKKIYETLAELEGGIGGFDFARVLSEYYLATIRDDNDRKSACLRYLRGEFAGKTEAKNALGFPVSAIITDDNWYDYIKLWSLLSVHLGYRGLILYIDECINLYKIPNRISRENNYEKLLSVFNDVLQGRAPYLGVFFGGTPQFLEDTRRGLFSYEALRSRLTDGRFYEMGYTDFNSPVIRLRRLSDNELLALLARLTKLHAMQNGKDALVSGEEMQAFLTAALSRAGAEELVTPREIIRDFLMLLNILLTNPDADFKTLMAGTATESQETPTVKTEKKEVDFSDFEF